MQHPHWFIEFSGQCSTGKNNNYTVQQHTHTQMSQVVGTKGQMICTENSRNLEEGQSGAESGREHFPKEMEH